MDLREIQRLHAQYNAQPVVIDLASHAAAMPALPVPDDRSARPGLLAGMRRATKPALIALAVGALAAAGGISAAHIWHALHESAAKSPVIATSAASAPASTAIGEGGDMPVNAAPARPLTSSDFDGKQRQVAPSALSIVDPRALSLPATIGASSGATASTTRAGTAEQNVAASPIRAHSVSQTAVDPQPTASAQPVQPAPAQPPVPSVASRKATPADAASPALTTAVPKVASVPAQAASAELAAAKPTLRPLHHLTRRTHAAETGDAPATPEQPKAPAGKSGDVQLF
ncbi:hypothetical protein R75461_07982 [Paraburkholderia nemoris]|uniref:hypothetical protein n=1 Tax=Paraburkholderia nemoris TaxID=2793076 RepID=UPI00190D66F1|nr:MULTISPECIES: hypothetical protein [Paraburkholderia]MBK3786723.1 hypothetical protein [Paraburkholderia aspalathi]CAE6860989.1 hypothetical protein R75461_07982 [Paraburkholderia nemoris]